ncbi:MAG: hypothetical protein U0Q55_10060 [Vicinamibacterales bacterium]
MTSPHRRRREAPPASSPLPPLYTRWIRQALGALPPNETTATCSTCAMLPPAGVDPGELEGALFFDPRSKCCTYIPELPNFLVGNILLDTTPEARPGRESVQARIRAGLQVTPLGLDKPPQFAILYASNTGDLFGRATDLRCPHYLADSGGCGIWRHRMSTCCTWFCKYDLGSTGRVAWSAMRQLLRVIERVIAVHCVRTLAPGARALEHAQHASPVREPHLRAADLGAPIDQHEQQRIWGTYAGREEAFYEACGTIASALTWADIRALGGAELDLALDVARGEQAAVRSTSIPRALRLGSFTVANAGTDTVECTTLNAYDPLSIPRALFDRLHLFDGRPTRSALAALREEGIELSPTAVRKLVAHGFLVAASTSSTR